MEFIKSPLNYTGGKYKILQPIYQLFPQSIDTFVDLFAGGFNVGINSNANKIICNDQITYLIDLYQYLSDNDTYSIISDIKTIIDDFHLSKQNVEGYNFLRDRYNETKDIRDFFVLTFFRLIIKLDSITSINLILHLVRIGVVIIRQSKEILFVFVVLFRIKILFFIIRTS